MKKERAREKEIYKSIYAAFAVNIVLSVCKLLAGIFGRSSAMIADAVHSISDFATDIAVLFFVRISAKPEDERHNYGYGKYETLATIVVSIVLFGVAAGILINGMKLIVDAANGVKIPRPGIIAIVAACVSIAAKEGLYWYTIKIGRKTASKVVIANAWHHRSDAFSSIASLFGIAGARFLGEKWRILDPLAAIIVAFFIGKIAYDLLRPALDEMLERSLTKEEEKEILSIVEQHDDIYNPHSIRTRRIGHNVAIELHVCLECATSVDDAYSLIANVKQSLRERFGPDAFIIIQTEPLAGQ